LCAKPVYKALKKLGFKKPTSPQTMAIPPILNGKNVLLVGPNGSGKTEAALLPVLSSIIQEDNRKGIIAIYITPLRALNRDMLDRLLFWSTELNISIQVRHGDTKQGLRRKQALSPPSMLVTTPETLQAILPGSLMKKHLSHVKHVIIDEVHVLASSKRGVQLTVGLERLHDIVGTGFQRIGLSATLADPPRVAKFIAGTQRNVEVVEALPQKKYRYRVETPIPEDRDYELAGDLRTSAEAAARIRRIGELVDGHSSTLIFVNSRQNAEMLGHRFDQLGRSEIAVHHSSLSKEERLRIENNFKAGNLKAIICTSTLELGIDIGHIDLVIQYLSPRRVSSLIQRVGRSGHDLKKLSKGVIITAFPDDTLESMAAISDAYKGNLEPLVIHDNPLDVLAHQVAGILLDNKNIDYKTLLKKIRKAYPYRNLTEDSLLEVTDYMDWLNQLRIDEEGKILRRTGKTRRYYYENLSMIPDEKRYPIIDVVTDRKIGTLGDEFMSLNVRLGLNFICKGTVWRIVQIDDEIDTVYVVPSENPFAAIPGWDGEILPVPYSLAQETGRMRGRIATEFRKTGKAKTVTEKLSEEFDIDKSTLVEAIKEIREHLSQGAPLPTHDQILLENYGKYVIIHACFGELVNHTLGCIFDAILSDRNLIIGWWNDGYRILIEMPRRLNSGELKTIATTLFNLSKRDVKRYFRKYMQARFPFSYKLKFVAERFGALPRGKTILDTNRYRQLTEQFRNTPIYDEAIRETMLDKLNIGKAKEIIRKIKSKKINVHTLIRLENPTPLSKHILEKYSDIPELMVSEQTLSSNVDKMRKVIEARKVTLFCFSCGKSSITKRLRDLSEHPSCKKCGARLLGMIRFNQEANHLEELLKKRLENQDLTEEELKKLALARRSADLILSYGKKAIVALEVKGIGPETAFRILGRMHQKEEEFYLDLMKAKITFIRSRPYWDKD
jgi:ATP-dependent Lhr-like helicase